MLGHDLALGPASLQMPHSLDLFALGSPEKEGFDGVRTIHSSGGGGVRITLRLTGLRTRGILALFRTKLSDVVEEIPLPVRTKP